MHRRMGFEALSGVGGGRISKESLDNLEIAEDLCRRRRPREAVPYLHKAMKDPRNLDAWVQAAFLAPNLDESTECLIFAEKQGREYLKKDIGRRCFDDGGDSVGHFWSIVETRPYMRVLQALIRIHIENKQYGKAADVSIEMLRLCPGDNLGVRFALGALLTMAGRHSEGLSYMQAWLEDPLCGAAGGKKPPFKTPLSPERVEGVSHATKADIPYSAALAAFHLWGDCMLARQYLLIGARLNPQVLLKILARIDRPKSQCDGARKHNSTEDAHDYLWLAQDAWMEPDVWAWASAQADARAAVLKRCARRGCEQTETEAAQFKRCSACHQVVYCSAACQKQDWKVHRVECKQRAQMKQLMRAIVAGKTPTSTGSSSSADAPSDPDASSDHLGFVGAAADFAEDGSVAATWF